MQLQFWDAAAAKFPDYLSRDWMAFRGQKSEFGKAGQISDDFYGAHSG